MRLRQPGITGRRPDAWTRSSSRSSPSGATTTPRSICAAARVSIAPPNADGDTNVCLGVVRARRRARQPPETRRADQSAAQPDFIPTAAHADAPHARGHDDVGQRRAAAVPRVPTRPTSQRLRQASRRTLRHQVVDARRPGPRARSFFAACPRSDARPGVKFGDDKAGGSVTPNLRSTPTPDTLGPCRARPRAATPRPRPGGGQVRPEDIFDAGAPARRYHAPGHPRAGELRGGAKPRQALQSRPAEQPGADH